MTYLQILGGGGVDCAKWWEANRKGKGLQFRAAMAHKWIHLDTYIPTYRKLVTQYIQNLQKQTSVRQHRVKMEVPVKTDLGATSVLVEVASLGHIVKRVRWHSLITHTCYAMRGDIRHLFDCKGCVVWVIWVFILIKNMLVFSNIEVFNFDVHIFSNILGKPRRDIGKCIILLQSSQFWKL